MNGIVNIRTGFSLSRIASFYTLAQETYIDPVFGVRTTLPTNAVIGVNGVLAIKYASPTGTGTGTINSPYSLADGLYSVVAGDVLFLRGGDYVFPAEGIGIRLQDKTGTIENPIIIESYNGEVAILDGQNKTPQDVIDGTYDTSSGLWFDGVEHINIRKIHVTGMWASGIRLDGRYCKVEGCKVYLNFATGLYVANRDDYTMPYVDGWNTIQDNEIYGNSDVGIIDGGEHNNGDHADGISISSGQYNIVRNNHIYDNADDSLDIWKSNDTEVMYNIVHDGGKGIGSGIGIKMGGNSDPADGNGFRGHAHHNIVYNCTSSGLVENNGRDVRINNNTSYNNDKLGYDFLPATPLTDNISSSNTDGDARYLTGDNRINNSWNIGGEVEFVSTDPSSPDFLRPIVGSPHEGIGAYADTDTTNPFLATDVPIWIQGSSSVADYPNYDGTPENNTYGWGTILKDELLQNSGRVDNRARSGASSKSYLGAPTYSTNCFWGDGHTLDRGNKGLKQDILEADTTHGGYLLITLGANDFYEGWDGYDENSSVPNLGCEFDATMMEYISFAREQNVIPIIVTMNAAMNAMDSIGDPYSVSSRAVEHLDYTTPNLGCPNSQGDSIEGADDGDIGDWAQTMRDVATRENVLMIDLLALSREHYETDFASSQDCIDLYSQSGVGGTDVSHTNLVGARVRAEFVEQGAREIGGGFAYQFLDV